MNLDKLIADEFPKLDHPKNDYKCDTGQYWKMFIRDKKGKVAFLGFAESGEMAMKIMCGKIEPEQKKPTKARKSWKYKG